MFQSQSLFFLWLQTHITKKGMSYSVTMHTDRNFGSFNFWVQLWAAARSSEFTTEIHPDSSERF